MAKRSGVTIATASFGDHSEVTETLLFLGHLQLTGKVARAYRYRESLGVATGIFLPKICLGTFWTRRIEKAEEIWDDYSRKPENKDLKLVFICGAEYFPLAEILRLKELLNRQGVDVVLIGRPGKRFYRLMAYADIKLREQELCPFPEGNSICGRTVHQEVWINRDGYVPILEFFIQILEIVSSLSWPTQLKPVSEHLRLALKFLRGIDVTYPPIPADLPIPISELLIHLLLIPLFGNVERVKRCRAHTREGLKRSDHGGRIISITGTTRSRKSFAAANLLQEWLDGPIVSPAVKIFSALPRSTDSELIRGYEPQVVRSAEEIKVGPEVTHIVIDEVELLGPGVAEKALSLARESSDRRIILVGFNPRWDDRPFANTASIIGISDEIVNRLGKCFLCRELASRTALVSVKENGATRVDSDLFRADEIPSGIKERDNLRVRPICLTDSVSDASPLVNFTKKRRVSLRGRKVALDFLREVSARALKGDRIAIALVGLFAGLLLFPSLVGYIGYFLGWPLRNIVWPLASAFIFPAIAALGFVLPLTFWLWGKERHRRYPRLVVLWGGLSIIFGWPLISTILRLVEVILRTALDLIVLPLEALSDRLSPFDQELNSRLGLGEGSARLILIIVLSLFLLAVLLRKVERDTKINQKQLSR